MISNTISDKTKIFKALSDISRLRILKALQTRTLCVCEIKELLGLANSTVSQHLKILKESGFITEQKEGKWINYSISQSHEDKRISALLSSLDFWIADSKIIIDDKKKIDRLDRNIICR